MKDTRSAAGTGRAAAAAFLALVFLSACAPKAAHRQTDLMEKSGAVSMSATELRIRVSALADRMAARLEGAADRIRAETGDRAVRRRALLVKIDTIPAVYAAAYRTDPLVAALDLWALALQLSDYVEGGAGRDAFGPQQPLAREAARDLLADADAVLEGMASRAELYTRARARLAAWVAQHPVRDTFSARPSVAAFRAELREEKDAFAAVGAVSETVESLSERMNTYAAQLPRQVRWQAELLVTDVAGENGVEDALQDLDALGEASRQASRLMAQVPDTPEQGASLLEAVARERRAMLAAVDRQRMQTLEYVTAERNSVLAALRDERIALTATLRTERIETLAEMDSIKSRAVDTSLAGLREIVDHALLRAGLLLAGLMIVAAALGLISYWLTVGRRRASS
jgi:hypothetical protein